MPPSPRARTRPLRRLALAGGAFRWAAGCDQPELRRPPQSEEQRRDGEQTESRSGFRCARALTGAFPAEGAEQRIGAGAVHAEQGLGPLGFGEVWES